MFFNITSSYIIYIPKNCQTAPQASSQFTFDQQVIIQADCSRLHLKVCWMVKSSKRLNAFTPLQQSGHVALDGTLLDHICN